MKAKIFGVAFAALLALGLAACSNMDSGSVNGLTLGLSAQTSKTRNVSIVVGGDVKGVDNGISATVLPGVNQTTTAFKFSLDQITCVLTGKSHLGGGVSQIIHPDAGTGKVNLNLNAALWDLTLTAYSNDGFDRADWHTPATTDEDGTEWPTPNAAETSGDPVLIATTSVDLRNGGDTIEFKLSAAGLTGKGGVVTIAGEYVDKSVVTDYVIGLYSISDNRPVDVKGAAIAEVKNASPLTPTTGNVDFTGSFNNVAAGSYRAAVALYNSEKTQVGYWSDIVILNPGVASIKNDIVIDNLLEPPAAPEHLAAYLVPGSYEKKNDGYYQVRLVWEDKSTNENYFRIKLDRYGVTDKITYTAATGTASNAVVYYSDDTGTICDPQPEAGSTLPSGLYTAANNPDTRTASDAGFPLYLSPVASGGDTVYRTSPYYSPEFVDLEDDNKCGLLAGSQTVVLTLETGYIYEVKVVAHNAMGDSKAASPASDSTGTTGGGIWTEREAAGTESDAVMTGLGYTVDAADLTKYVAYEANDATELVGINLMSIKYLLGGGRNYTTSSTVFVNGPLFKYFRYNNGDPAKLLRKAAASASTGALPSGFDFYSAVWKTSTDKPVKTVSELGNSAFPIIIKPSGNSNTATISDFSYWANPDNTLAFDIVTVTAQNVTVLARYGNSTSGHVTIEDLQEIDAALIKASYADSKAGADAGTSIKTTTTTIPVTTDDMWVYLAVDTSANDPVAGPNYNRFRFFINGDEQYASSNERYIPLNELESGTYHVLIEAYDSVSKRWYGYQFQFKLSR